MEEQAQAKTARRRQSGRWATAAGAGPLQVCPVSGAAVCSRGRFSLRAACQLGHLEVQHQGDAEERGWAQDSEKWH